MEPFSGMTGSVSWTETYVSKIVPKKRKNERLLGQYFSGGYMTYKVVARFNNMYACFDGKATKYFTYYKLKKYLRG